MSANESMERPIESVLLNAVHATIEGRNEVFTDETSMQTVRHAYEAATTPDMRQSFERAIKRETAPSEESEEAADVSRVIGSVVEAVHDELATKDARVCVDHQAMVEIPPREATLYTYSRTRDASVLDRLSLSASAESHVKAGAKHVDDQDYAAAAAAFEKAVDASGGEDGSVSTRVLAGWAYHWNGDDAQAIDLIDEALYFHMDAWTPNLVGYAADHQRPDQFRSGKLGACALLRQTVDVPDGCSVDAALGFANGDGDEIEWQSLEGPDDCMPTDRLAPETYVRLRLEGPVPDFPALHGYHLSVGVVDLEVDEVRDIYHVLLSGPETAGATETITVKT